MSNWQRSVAVFAILIGVYVGSLKESGAQSSTLTAFYTAPVVSMAPMWIAKEAWRIVRRFPSTSRRKRQ